MTQEREARGRRTQLDSCTDWEGLEDNRHKVRGGWGVSPSEEDYDEDGLGHTNALMELRSRAKVNIQGALGSCGLGS